MQCPQCGNEIPEGKLYCPTCGYAVQIVPDYDADLEENLDSVGTDIAGNVNRIDVADNSRVEFDEDSTTKEIPMVKKDKASDLKKKYVREDEAKEKIGTVVIAGVLGIILILVAYQASRLMDSGSFIPQKAVDDVVSGNGIMGSNTVSEIEAVTEEATPSEDTVSAGALSDNTVSEDALNGKVEGELIITPEAGKYTKPQNISAVISVNGDVTESEEAEVPEGEEAEDKEFAGIIYYTDDGSEPDESSEVFKKGFPMPLGHSSYSFRFLDSKGNLSDVVTVEYDLEYAGGCTPVDAVNTIIATLIKDGALLDIYGHVAGSTGLYTYRCDTMVSSGNRDYYIIPESYGEPGGSKRETGTVYAVDAATLETFTVRKSSDGKYSFELFF
ncbi:MAG: chitobiase/beta-hexosaminidase C-terminal domain-containing protein [Lachnospiraceae bacterium]|nr:chitobiase/beta-hexosaminidase C-terminal domain-containing protein [Lachnospiraceae bacterium]